MLLADLGILSVQIMTPQPSGCTSDEIDAENCGGHGTSIAGMIAAEGWNNIGVRGIAPNASLIGYNLLENSLTGNYLDALGTNPLEAYLLIYIT